MGESSKYDFNIPDKPSGTHGLILSHIEPGNKVLECGCASGYMTKYMNEKLRCDVDIIEIDKECIEKAKQYAFDWFQGDLMNNAWYEYFKHRQYDRIMFADVLEHLTDPLTVLSRAVTLLKPDGKVVISIPNICHNDILIRMFYDDWTYSNMGLLDNTHVHFWGGRNFTRFADDAGLKIETFECTTIPTQQTEQMLPIEINPQLLELLKNRLYGEVYQWIFTCVKK